MEDLIIIAILAVVIGFAARYVYKAKKSGKKCIGCPEGCSCGTKNGQSFCGSCQGCKEEME